VYRLGRNVCKLNRMGVTHSSRECALAVGVSPALSNSCAEVAVVWGK